MRESIEYALGIMSVLTRWFLADLTRKVWPGLLEDGLEILSQEGNPDDMDIATTLTPEQIKSIFPRSLMVGASFGTVIVRLDDDFEEDLQWQVTTLRSEGDYSDGRRPETVSFLEEGEGNSGIFADLSRRDFTINSMAIDSRGRLLRSV